MSFHSPEEKIKALERMVNQLIEESCQSSARGENQVVSQNISCRRKLYMLHWKSIDNIVCVESMNAVNVWVFNLCFNHMSASI